MDFMVKADCPNCKALVLVTVTHVFFAKQSKIVICEEEEGGCGCDFVLTTSLTATCYTRKIEAPQ